jgi:dolichol-phosphate mannosyltransferase
MKNKIPKFLNSPPAVLTAFLVILLLVLASGWLSSTPSQEELYGDVGRYLHEFKAMFSPGGISWWSPAFLSGVSSAAYLMFALPSILGLVATSVFGDEAGLKILMLTGVAAVSVGTYLLTSKLTGQRWVGVLAGILCAVNAQTMLRVASFEHFNSVVCVAFAPFILFSFLKVAEEGSLRSSFVLAVCWSGMMLSYAKLTLMFLPLATAFYVWLLIERRDQRVALVRGTLIALLLVSIMAVPLLLPLAREYQWAAVFTFDNFEGWQRSFSIKSFLSVFDRGNGLMAGMPPNFTADRGQFYLGLVAVLVIGGIIWQSRAKSSVWLASREGGLFRLFLGLGLFSLWLAQGPFSAFTGLQEFLKSSNQAPDWIAAMVWLATLLPLLLIYAILPATPHRGWWTALFAFVYLFVPGFVILEYLPLYRDIRAPWGFWEVGFFTVPVAAAIALHHLFTSSVERRDRFWAGVLLSAIVMLDSSVYLAKFFEPGLPVATFEDFRKGQKYLANSLIEGRVYPLSGRYFYLRTPMESGRGLNSEAIWSHFQMRGARALIAGANSSPVAMQTYMRVGGISHVLIDKKDPFTPPEIQNAFAQGYPTGFDSQYIRVLENKDSLAPAFIAREYIAMDSGTEVLAPAFLDAAGRINAVPVELEPNERTIPFLVGTGSDQSGIQISPNYSNSSGAVFRRVPFALPRTNPSKMVFDPFGSREGWLVISEAWHPDWRAFSDGAEIPVYKAFGGLMSVPLGRTNGQIELIFSAPSWYSLCVWISGFSWAGVLGVLLIMPLPFIPKRWKDWWSAANKKTPLIAAPATPISKAVVVIPTYNERESINKALDLVLNLPRKLDVLVVDDGSPDGTADVVRSRPEYNKRVFLLEGKGKAGLGTAYRRGFQWALKHGYQAAVEMDADLSHDPTDVPKLLEALEGGAHLAVGSRYLGGISVLNWPQSRLFISTFGGFYVRTLTALPMSDPTSGFKAIRAELLRDLDWNKVQAEGYAFQIELHHAAWKQGYTLKEVPIVFTERREGDSKMSAAISLEAAWRVLRLAARS